VATASAGGGRLVRPARAQHGTVEGVRFAPAGGPSWLVLGEGYSKGWRAWCDGHELGDPEPVDAFANGWRVPHGCRIARFAFGPDGLATAGYLISALAALVLALASGVLLVRRRRVAEAGPPAQAPPGLSSLPDDLWPARWDWHRAIAAGAVAGAVLGFVFAIRAGVMVAPAVAIILRRGVRVRTLAAAAAILLGVVVPAIYEIWLPRDKGGYRFTYPVDLIAAHWAAVAALVLLAIALAGVLSTARSRNRAPGPPP
jgi:hypothetical protein